MFLGGNWTLPDGEVLEQHTCVGKTRHVSLRESAFQPLIYRINLMHTQNAKNDIVHFPSPPTTMAILSLFSYIVVKVIESLIRVHNFQLSFSANLR